jgi:hypothetical protein
MNLYQRLMIGAIFVLLCAFALLAGHGIGLLGLFMLPLLAIAGALTVKMLIEIVLHAQQHDL